MTEYTTVIGLEVHVQLNTTSKAFCADSNQFGQEPNSNISAVSLALPGTLPVLNQSHVKSAVKLAHALGAAIHPENRFDRKNYFYPDLPKGYQITQDNVPICVGGNLCFESEGEKKKVRIHHVHMEEDAGKSVHDLSGDYSMVDYNRAGTPLLEIVTEPDLRSGQEVSDFIATLQQLVRNLDISDGNMEEGSLRCDVNISVMPKGSSIYGERCEVKNVNSKKFAKQAVEFESKRQISLIGKGEKIPLTTLLFDPETGSTAPMRSKEEANDYRYFPDPDLPPVFLTDEYLKSVTDEIVALPWTARQDLIEEFNLSEYDAEIISRELGTYLFFKKATDKATPATISSILINKILPALSESLILQDINVSNIGSLAVLMDSGKVNKSQTLNILGDLILSSKKTEIDIHKLAVDHNLMQSDDQSFLDDIISKVLTENEGKLIAYRKGKKGLQGFFMGQVMRLSQGKANPKILSEKLNEALKGK